MNAQVQSRRQEESNYMVNLNRANQDSGTEKHTRFSGTSNPVRKQQNDHFSSSYMPSNEFFTTIEQNGFVAAESGVYKDLQGYGQLADLETYTYGVKTLDEWDRSKVAKVEKDLVNFWMDQFNNPNVSLRDTIHSTYFIQNRSSSGENNHLTALKTILKNVKSLPNHIRGKTIPVRDADGNITNDPPMTLEEFATKALADGSNSFLEQYIDSPGLKTALNAAARNYLNTDTFKNNLRYDREFSNGASQFGHAVGGTVGTAGAVLGTALLAKLGIAATTGVISWGLSGGTATGVTGVIGTITALAAAGPVGWAALGVLAVGAVALTALAVSSVKESATYIKDNRNDAPGLLNPGQWIGWSINSMLQGWGIRSSANDA